MIQDKAANKLSKQFLVHVVFKRGRIEGGYWATDVIGDFPSQFLGMCAETARKELRKWNALAFWVNS